MSYTSSSKLLLFFSQTQLAMQFPSKQTQAAAQLAMHFPAEKYLICSTRFECLISHCLHGGAYVRTLYGRSDGSDVITKPKFLALMGLPKSLSYGAELACACGARGSSAIIISFFLLSLLKCSVPRPKQVYKKVTIPTNSSWLAKSRVA